MHALTFNGIENILYSAVNEPVIVASTDAIVKIKMAGVCGSDLHVYHGRETGIEKGTVMGHEFTGEIVETGTAVKNLHKGSRVLSPFTTSCGECYYCRIGLTCRCVKGNLFGWIENGHGLHGAQAEYIRVPMADSTLVPLSNDLSDEKGLLLGDIFSTGYFCAENAGVNNKARLPVGQGVYVVIGCGPVGLMAIIAAKHLGAEKIFAIDSIEYRLDFAKKLGAVPLNFLKDDMLNEIKNKTDGRGADAVMEVVGSADALSLAIKLLRPGGIISSAGVHTSKTFPFSPGEAYDKNLVYKIGRCPARYYAEKLIREEVAQRCPIEDIISHRFELSEGAMAYNVFTNKLDNCIKPVLIT
jgi:threonine dehydrogenase-like Zn-dependent dehydrogenase